MSRILIGFTENDHYAEYIPALDGWTPDSKQYRLDYTLPPGLPVLPLEEVAEAFFEASNAPAYDYETGEETFAKVGTLVRYFQDSLYSNIAGKWRSLSVGDSVAYAYVNAAGEYIIQELVSCERLGWKKQL